MSTAVQEADGYTYDKLGNVTSMIDANGNRTYIMTPADYHISRSYDDRDRLITERVEDKANDIDRTTFITYDRKFCDISIEFGSIDFKTVCITKSE